MSETTRPAAEPLAARMAAEARALRVSLVVSVAIAVGALAVGIVSGSRVIVFDGVYVLVGLLLTWASMAASRAVAAGPTRLFPFGRDTLAPLVVVAQGLGIAAALVIAAADAVIVIREGGGEANAWALGLYGGATAVVGLLVAALLVRRAGDSDIVRAEAEQWRAGAALSAVMIVGAVAVTLLAFTPFPELAGYVDPALVLISCALLAVVPIRMFRSGLNELLEGAPSAELLARIEEAVRDVQREHGLPEPLIRAGKVGRKLYVEADFLVADPAIGLQEEDAVRRAMRDRLLPLGYDVWTYVALTRDAELLD